MKSYYYPTWFFKKKWIWFDNPKDISDADMVTFFSYNDVEISGFKKKRGLTSVIDLTQGKDVVWNGMRSSFIQKQIRKGIRNGITVKQDKNFKEFKKIYYDFRSAKDIAKDTFSVFEKNGILVSAYYDNQMVSGGVFIADEKHMRAWVLASKRLNNISGKEREIIGQANRMVLWEAIQYALEYAISTFDIGGINPHSSNKTEQSLALFKESFGGVRTETFFYTKIYSKLLRFMLRFR